MAEQQPNRDAEHDRRNQQQDDAERKRREQITEKPAPSKPQEQE